MFINREREISKLLADLENRKSMAILYGRRRVGKTRLVREALRSRQHIFLYITNESPPRQLAYLQKTLAEIEGHDVRFTSIDDLLTYLFNRYAKVPIVIDEFQRFDIGTMSRIQHIWDEIFL